MPPTVRKKKTPSYCLHKPSARAYVTLDGKPVYLGTFGTNESREKYHRVIGEWEANGRRLPPPVSPSPSTTVAQLLAAFWRHAQEYHRNADGSPAGEADNYRLAMRPLKKLYAETPVEKFDPVAMKNVRREMIAMGWARTYINRQLGRVRHIFDWAVGEGMIPAAISDAIAKVKGLRQGKTDARESDPVKPVADEHFKATLPFLSPTVKAMVELQILTGMRPGEVCSMRNKDIDAPKGKLWHYNPGRHKTQHHGVKRIVPLGPKAREIITPYMGLDPEAHLFNPAKEEADRHARQREERQTPVQPSQVKRAADARRRRSKRAPGDFYDVATYRRAIARACEKAFKMPVEIREPKTAQRKMQDTPKAQEIRRAARIEWRRLNVWHPHQLRHNAATLIRELYGLETAQAILGHKNLTMTQVYAERNLKAADRVMNEVG